MKTGITSIIATTALAAALSTQAAEYHVAKNGRDTNKGAAKKPLLTIQRAADVAQPGDTITVHEGVYRERVNPPRGGTSDVHRITYQAAPGEEVVVKGSEPVSGWTHVTNDTWMVTLSNSFFGGFNPFNDLIQGDWFDPLGRDHHTGAVYLNGDWLTEAVALTNVLSAADDSPLWFALVDEQDTMIHAQFPSVDPNNELVEVNARQTVFYPDQPGRNYITVRGFTLTQAATPWSPPTIEQIGLIGTHWSKGWIVESNAISYSVCAGLTLGLNDRGEYSGDLEGYTQLIMEAMGAGGWNKESVGSHIVRGNTITKCEQAGICGSLGGAFSVIENNEISYIYVRRLFAGAEQGGIKLHGAVDTVIRDNLIHDGPRAIWLDWMGQGAEISGNVAFNNLNDLYLEVNHGPALVANNLFLSPLALSNKSRGTAFAHNLFVGRCSVGATDRITPYLEPHSTIVEGDHANDPGDDRFYNNVYAGRSASYASFVGEYNDPELPVTMQDNLFIKGSQPYAAEVDPMLFPSVSPDLETVQKSDGIYIEWSSLGEWTNTSRQTVTTELLGSAGVSGARFEQADGSSIKVDRDYFGTLRDEQNPIPGPFELPTGNLQVRIWPKNELVVVTNEVPFLIGQDDFDGTTNFVNRVINNAVNNTDETFDIVNRINILYAGMVDTSVVDTPNAAINTNDVVGFAESTLTDNFFGIYRPNVGPDASLVYTFDISGYTDLNLSMDWITSGRVVDQNTSVSYAIDGGAASMVFDIDSSNDGGWNQTMEDGRVIRQAVYASPWVNGVQGDKVTDLYQTYNSTLAGRGSLLTVTVVQIGVGSGYGGFGLDNLKLYGLLLPPEISYDAWIASYVLTGSDTNYNADVEPDGRDNLMEYALGGNPTNDDAAVSPSTFMAADGDTHWFYHVYNKRTDDPALHFIVGATTNLVSTPPDTNAVSFVGQSAEVGGFRMQTNRTEATSDATFIQLKVEK